MCVNVFYTPQLTTLQLFALFSPKQLLKCPKPSFSGHILIDGRQGWAMAMITNLLLSTISNEGQSQEIIPTG